MLLLRAALLEFLVCFHVIGAAVLFRRFFPRESAWLALILPTLAVMMAFNFVEHFIALPNLGWLLPVSMGGLLWAMLRPGYSWAGLRFPLILFVLVFSWVFFIRCLNPQITCNTEGVADMARMVDFSLGNKLPPVDTWCPPYDHGGYYTFQHYGASLLTRLFSLDIGTGYNVGYSLLNTFTLLVGTGAAYLVSGRRMWVAILTLLVLLGNFSGSFLYLVCYHFTHFHEAGWSFWGVDSRLAVDIGDDWSNPERQNHFDWIFKPFRALNAAYNPPVLRLFTPAFNTYFPEFHANLGGHFMTLASVLAANEVNRQERSNWPWICLLILPLLTLITSTWFFIIVTVICGGSMLVALFSKRLPENWQFVAMGAFIAGVLVWPSIDSLVTSPNPVTFTWTWNHVPLDFTPPWEFVIQWWPVIVPWLLLCFVWLRLSPFVRFFHVAVPFLLIFIECATFGDRGLTVEKMWGAVYGASLVTLLPLVFVQRHVLFRLTTIFYLLISILFITVWIGISTQDVYWNTIAFRLRGDSQFQNDPQKKRLEQVLNSVHGVTVLSRSVWSYNESPSLIGFTGNMCYIAWYAQEYQCGHGGEAEYRNEMTNQFFDGKMADPLPFLRSNNIAAILIYPEDDPKDATSDNMLQEFKTQLASDYYYVDCKAGGDKNAGVFLRLPGH